MLRQHLPWRALVPTRSSRGFTLIELLMVITIISLLIALILPALDQSRQMAKQLRCNANLKQISLAMAVYRNDFADKIVAGRINYDPGATVWHLILGQGNGAGVLRGMEYYPDYWKLRCPEADYSTGTNIYLFNNSSMVQWNFQSPTPGIKGAAAGANGVPSTKWLRLSDYGKPDRVIQLLDTQSPSSWQCTWSSGVRYWAIGTGPNPSRVGDMHNNGTNMLWLDGHTSWLPVNSSFFATNACLDWTTIP
jgi:prepilin-type N-terminal cleavage/methylation domain-containing protein/prepilin-type processing-associated H-X9-DG protein